MLIHSYQPTYIHTCINADVLYSSKAYNNVVEYSIAEHNIVK